MLEGHTAPVKDMATAADGSMVVTASEDGTARAWDLVSSPASTYFCFSYESKLHMEHICWTNAKIRGAFIISLDWRHELLYKAYEIRPFFKMWFTYARISAQSGHQ